MLTGQALWTEVDLAVVAIVMNDGAFGNVKRIPQTPGPVSIENAVVELSRIWGLIRRPSSAG